MLTLGQTNRLNSELYQLNGESAESEHVAGTGNLNLASLLGNRGEHDTQTGTTLSSITDTLQLDSITHHTPLISNDAPTTPSNDIIDTNSTLDASHDILALVPSSVTPITLSGLGDALIGSHGDSGSGPVTGLISSLHQSGLDSSGGDAGSSTTDTDTTNSGNTDTGGTDTAGSTDDPGSVDCGCSAPEGGVNPIDDTTTSDNDILDLDLGVLGHHTSGATNDNDLLDIDLGGILGTSDNHATNDNDLVDLDLGGLLGTTDNHSPTNDNDLLDLDLGGILGHTDSTTSATNDNDLADLDLGGLLGHDSTTTATNDNDLADLDLGGLLGHDATNNATNDNDFADIDLGGLLGGEQNHATNDNDFLDLDLNTLNDNSSSATNDHDFADLNINTLGNTGSDSSDHTQDAVYSDVNLLQDSGLGAVDLGFGQFDQGEGTMGNSALTGTDLSVDAANDNHLLGATLALPDGSGGESDLLGFDVALTGDDAGVHTSLGGNTLLDLPLNQLNDTSAATSSTGSGEALHQLASTIGLAAWH